ncbi:MAG TPA: NfeD family protein [Mycobacteriales bacterium]|nr:NfeD family protein [Mycobacteriales bacterium]
MDAALWLVAGVLLVLVEVFTLTVAAGMVGVGALAAALAAALGAPLAVQAGVFVVTSAGLVVFAREPVQRALSRGRDNTALDARVLTGTSAVVVERVSETSGQVRVHGELWRARPYAGTGPVEPGATVTVAAVEGATVLVYSPDL